MKSVFEPSRPEELEAIAGLLERAFGVDPDALFLRRDYLRWKYFDGPEGASSRSWVLRGEDGVLLAHAAIWPVRLRLEAGVREGISFGDWVAGEQHKGMGLLLLKKLMTLRSFVVVTGGAPITRAILPRAGFVPWAERQIWARVVRPVRQARTRTDSKGMKEPLRMLRNAMWSVGGKAAPRGWSAEEEAASRELVDAAGEGMGTVHGPAALRHMLLCPTVRFRLVGLRCRGRLRGWSLVGFAGGQARIAELRLASAEQADWSSAVRAVVEFAKRDAETCEVMAYGSGPRLDGAMEENGFRRRGRTPVVVYDAEGLMAKEPLPQLGLLEDDAASLFEPGFVYRT